MSDVAIALLSGGRGERLGGVRKADLRIGGRRLLDRLLMRLPAENTSLLLAGGTTGDTRLRCVPDLLVNIQGPLAGLAGAVAALEIAPPRYLLTIAVDTPFFPREFLPVALREIGSADAAIASWQGQHYPTNGLWRFEAIADLPEALVAGHASDSPRALLRTLDLVALEWSERASANPFASANTMADMLALGRRARDGE